MSIYQHLRIGDKIAATLALVVTTLFNNFRTSRESPTGIFRLQNQKISYFHVHITKLLDVLRPEKWVSWDLMKFSGGKCRLATEEE